MRKNAWHHKRVQNIDYSKKSIRKICRFRSHISAKFSFHNLDKANLKDIFYKNLIKQNFNIINKQNKNRRYLMKIFE